MRREGIWYNIRIPNNGIEIYFSSYESVDEESEDYGNIAVIDNIYHVVKNDA